MSETDNTASRFLGKRICTSQIYDPSLLTVVTRNENRKHYDIDTEYLPFDGYDVWHAYEFSSMSENGVPVTRLMKFKYSCKNEFIIESKSLKLYLNSFNMTRFGQNTKECLEICKNNIKHDLSEKLQTEVDVNFFDNNVSRIGIFEGFRNIIDFVDENTLLVKNFKEAPELIEVESTNEPKEYYLTFDSLRSNCRVTHQPDFGDIFIYYKSLRHIREDSLIKYLVSFRSEYHFHEECCEMIFKRLYDVLNMEDELLICMLYTRRGGIDICPVRHSRNCRLGDALLLADPAKFARYGIKQ